MYRKRSLGSWFLHRECTLSGRFGSNSIRLVLVKLRLQYILEIDVRDLEKYLPLLPTSLNDAYEKLLKRIHWSNYRQHTAFKMFSWLYFAQRSLRIEELREALSVREEDDSLTSRHSPSGVDILKDCNGLVVWDESNEKITVAFAHQTVNKFLKNKQAQLYPIDIAVICLKCLWLTLHPRIGP